MFEIAAALPGSSVLKTAPDAATTAVGEGMATNPFQAILAIQVGDTVVSALAGAAAPLPAGGKDLPVAALPIAGLPDGALPGALGLTDAAPALPQGRPVPGFPVAATAIGLVQISAAEAEAAAAGTLVETGISAGTDEDDESVTAAALPVADLSVMAALLSQPMPLAPAKPTGDRPAISTGQAAGLQPAVRGASERVIAARAVTTGIVSPDAGKPMPAAAAPAQVLSAVIERENSVQAGEPVGADAAAALASGQTGDAAGAAGGRAGRMSSVAARLAERDAAIAPLPAERAAEGTATDGFALASGTFASAQPAQATAASPSAAPRMERIDFATLVDSIARARDDAAGDAVKVAVAHADFGRVSLTFEPSADGLSVGMTSPDPGFARAVAVAGQAEGGAMNADSQQSRSDAQQRAADMRQGGTGDGASHQRGGSARRNDDVQQQPRRAAEGRGDEAGNARDGIFA